MGFRDTWYEATRDALRSIRGEGPLGPDGVAIALVTGLDTISVLGQLAPAVVNAIKAWNRHQGNQDGVLRSVFVDDDGHGKTTIGPTIPVESYVAGYGELPTAWRRSQTRSGDTYEISFIADDEPDLFGFLRTAVNHWQRAIDASVSAIRSCGVAVTNTAGSLEIKVFWAAIRDLCTDLDVLHENPPQPYWDKIRAAAIDSVHQTEQWAGKTAAELAAEAGKLAGNVGKGFFAEAGALSLVVAGIAVWLFIR